MGFITVLAIVVYNLATHLPIIVFVSILVLTIRSGYAWEGLGFAFIGVMVSILFCTMLIIISSEGMPFKWETMSTEIVSLRDDSQISGSFFLGSGSIEGDTYYMFYKKISENSFKQDKVRSERVVVEERNDINPRYSYDEGKKERKYLYGLSAIILDCSCTQEFSKVRNRTLTVPEGTIIKQFKLE
jgi:hypothetical protein